MASRLAALAVLVAAVGALAWAALAGDQTESVESAELGDTAVRVEFDSSVPAVTLDASEAAPEPTATPEPFPEPENFGPRMELVDIDGWLNTDANDLSAFDGQVLLIEMWTFGCHNCQARIPFNQSYAEEFGDDNFEIIGVHAPEFRHEADVDNIIAAMDRLGVDWPVALDTDKKNFREWQPGRTNYWPRTYVIDQNGDIRYDHIGEGKYEELRETIRYLLDNPPAATAEPAASS